MLRLSYGLSLLLAAVSTFAAAEPTWVPIASGSYRPLFTPSEIDPKATAPSQSNKRNADLLSKEPKTTLIRVEQFRLQKDPVTNEDFLKFVSENPEWQKANVKVIFSDKMYLHHWNGAQKLDDPNLAQQPVVNVSWFAARAYCKWIGARLPTSDEWEYVISKDNPEQRDQTILEWYSKPTEPQISSSHYLGNLGVRDMVGKIWEWTLDFNSSFVTDDSREGGSLSRSMFCGAGSIGSADPSAYATFMRLAFRSSLKSNYALPILGFRCAMDS